LLDVGCGWEARFLKSVEPYIASGIGIDFKAPNLETAKLKTITVTLEKIPIAKPNYSDKCYFYAKFAIFHGFSASLP
jgi:cyclopropane fatty-acyl-phospholipid synthase-like methyltransferase